MNEIDEISVIRFGSKALSKWQKSYGPTKLELLGMVTSVLEGSSYLLTEPSVIECDLQALKPLFSNQLKGAIYERWIVILQQNNFEIQYKPAREMQVPDFLSRCTQETSDAFESPNENDPYFPYEPATSQCDDTFLNQSTESSYIQDPDKIVNQSTASDNILDSDKIFEQSTHINDKQVNYTSYNDMSDNEITNNNTKKRDSVTGIDSDSNVNILTPIDIFREKGFSVDSIHELQRIDANCRPLIQYLETNELPKLQKEARRLLILILNFHMINGILGYLVTGHCGIQNILD
ncbi:unnamed protein product [Mytilus coruscus]|uniref:Reverse transcriptase RNase H-like domain-containing protein n=1 Tax=Mytilus coruscus TaxID=42192 RepID=A0A6J8CJU2_MYTCO|nr:unnamed protein product [Mytilus coruscus]